MAIGAQYDSIRAKICEQTKILTTLAGTVRAKRGGVAALSTRIFLHRHRNAPPTTPGCMTTWSSSSKLAARLRIARLLPNFPQRHNGLCKYGLREITEVHTLHAT
jgi:hypothetical protein